MSGHSDTPKVRRAATTGTGEAQRAVVVTGANGRLGRTVVAELQDRGMRPVSWVRSKDADASPPAIACDVTDALSVDRAFEETRRAGGAISGLVHAVGAWAASPLAEHDLAGWHRMIEINLTSAFHVVRAGLGRLAPGATMVLFAARQGVDGGMDGQAAYSAAKGGLVRLVEAARDEAAERGVSVCAVAPSTILFGAEADGDGPGIPASQLSRLVADLIEDGAAYNGAVLRAYGRS